MIGVYNPPPRLKEGVLLLQLLEELKKFPSTHRYIVSILVLQLQERQTTMVAAEFSCSCTKKQLYGYGPACKTCNSIEILNNTSIKAIYHLYHCMEL